MSQRRVVVTGLGATTPIGGDVDSTWKALLAGQSGVRLLTEDWRELLPVHFAARVAIEPADQMERVEMRRLDRSEQFALVASREAWKDAGSPDEVDKERLGVVIASGIGGVITLLDQFVNLNEKGARGVSPHTVPMLMPNGPAANVGLELQAKAGVHTPVSACASGAEAIGYAFEMIKNNRADIVVTGGVEAAIHQLPMAGFAAMKALSTRNDDPARASRPYDIDRDGFVMGEGSGVLVLEERQHAIARGANIYAEIKGYGMSGDAYHITAPAETGDGGFRAMQAAVRDANLSSSDLDYINAHGTSTPLGDMIELRAIGKLLEHNIDNTSISSTKSATGHLLGAAGAIEAIYSILSIVNQIVPPTNNLLNPDNETSSFDLVPIHAKKRSVKNVLSNSFGFGGTNASLLIGSAD